MTSRVAGRTGSKRVERSAARAHYLCGHEVGRRFRRLFGQRANAVARADDESPVAPAPVGTAVAQAPAHQLAPITQSTALAHTGPRDPAPAEPSPATAP